MSEVNLIEGEIFQDQRGVITSLNDFVFDGVERVYFIHHSDESVVRGWHGHKHEKKWFYCVKGSFTLALVKIDDWENPSTDLQAEIYNLAESKSDIIAVPEGYANCIKATSEEATLMVFSGKRLPEAYNDSWRYDSSLWVDWSKH